VAAMLPMRRLLYASEAAELVGVRASTIRSWVHRGHLQAHWYDEDRRPLYLDSDVYAAERTTRRCGPRKWTKGQHDRNI
jgi:predicted site-specific integrase-resolvase